MTKRDRDLVLARRARQHAKPDVLDRAAIAPVTREDRTQHSAARIDQALENRGVHQEERLRDRRRDLVDRRGWIVVEELREAPLENLRDGSASIARAPARRERLPQSREDRLGAERHGRDRGEVRAFRGITGTRFASERLGERDGAIEEAQVVSAPDELAREEIEYFRSRRLGPEVVDRFDEAASDELRPDPVDDRASEVRV